MSRGLGKIQRMCLSVLTEQDKLLDSITVAALAVNRNGITESEDVSFRRALRKLKTMGKVIDLERGFRDGRRSWATPTVAKRYLDRCGFYMLRSKAKRLRQSIELAFEKNPDMQQPVK